MFVSQVCRFSLAVFTVLIKKPTMLYYVYLSLSTSICSYIRYQISNLVGYTLKLLDLDTNYYYLHYVT